MSCEIDATTPQPVRLTVGQECRLQLRSNPTTGYRWERLPDGAAIVSTLDATYRQDARPASGPPLVGVGGVELFRLKAEQRGTATLRWVYRRPWEQAEPPAATFDLYVDVK